LQNGLRAHATPARWSDACLAAVRLDIDLDEIWVFDLLADAPRLAATDAAGRYLSLRRQVDGRQTDEKTVHDPMAELAADPSLGPRTRAHALEIAARSEPMERRIILMTRGADELDPASPARVRALALALRDAGRRDDAIRRFEETLARLDAIGNLPSTLHYAMEARDDLEQLRRQQ
jgi:hypothetical protein